MRDLRYSSTHCRLRTWSVWSQTNQLLKNATIGLWDSDSDKDGFLLIFLRFGDGIVITLTISEGSSLIELHSEVFVEGSEGRSDLLLDLLLDEPRLVTWKNKEIMCMWQAF